MYINLNYFYLSASDLKVKVAVILKYILPFSIEKHLGQATIYQVLEKC